MGDSSRPSALPFALGGDAPGQEPRRGQGGCPRCPGLAAVRQSLSGSCVCLGVVFAGVWKDVSRPG